MIWTLAILCCIIIPIVGTLLFSKFFKDETFNIFFGLMLVGSFLIYSIPNFSFYKLIAIKHYSKRLDSINKRIEKEENLNKKEYLERVIKPNIQKYYDLWNNYIKEEKNEDNFSS